MRLWRKPFIPEKSWAEAHFQDISSYPRHKCRGYKNLPIASYIESQVFDRTSFVSCQPSTVSEISVPMRWDGITHRKAHGLACSFDLRWTFYETSLSINRFASRRLSRPSGSDPGPLSLYGALSIKTRLTRRTSRRAIATIAFLPLPV
jgi:hypothetical protein